MTISNPDCLTPGEAAERERRIDAAVQRVLRRALDGYRENHWTWCGWTSIVARGRAVKKGDPLEIAEIEGASLTGSVTAAVFLEIPGCKQIGGYHEGWPFAVYGHAMVALATEVLTLAPEDFQPDPVPGDAPHGDQPNTSVQICNEYDRQCGSPRKAQDILEAAIAAVSLRMDEARG